MKSYYEKLPKGYFKGLYGKVIKALSQNQNVLVSSLSGGGGNTFLNLFFQFSEKENGFDQVNYYDPAINLEYLVDFAKSAKTSGKRSLVIVRLFERLSDKKEIIDKLHSIRYPNPEEISYLFVVNEDPIINPEIYTPTSGILFDDVFYIKPFDEKETTLMIKFGTDFYGWKVDSENVELIHKLSGGNPRLIKYLCKEVSEKGVGLKDKDCFANNSIVLQLNYFHKLLMSCNKKTLCDLGLINSKGKIVSDLLKKYELSYRSEYINELFPELSELELKVLSYLYEMNETIVSVDKIGDLFEMLGREFSLWAIYKLISRLKSKVSKYFIIKNIKGKGYLLKKSRTFKF